MGSFPCPSEETCLQLLSSGYQLTQATGSVQAVRMLEDFWTWASSNRILLWYLNLWGVSVVVWLVLAMGVLLHVIKSSNELAGLSERHHNSFIKLRLRQFRLHRHQFISGSILILNPGFRKVDLVSGLL